MPEKEPYKRKATVVGLITSFLYIALFLPSFYVGLLVPSLYENSNITEKGGTMVVFLSILLPCTMVLSIGLTWFCYFQNAFRLAFYSCFLPVAAFFLVLLALKAIDLSL